MITPKNIKLFVITQFYSFLMFFLISSWLCSFWMLRKMQAKYFLIQFGTNQKIFMNKNLIQFTECIYFENISPKISIIWRVWNANDSEWTMEIEWAKRKWLQSFRPIDIMTAQRSVACIQCTHAHFSQQFLRGEKYLIMCDTSVVKIDFYGDNRVDITFACNNVDVYLLEMYCTVLRVVKVIQRLC